MSKNYEHITCPCCGIEIQHDMENDTHIWSCVECPFVGFEFVKNKDTKNLSAYLGVK